MEEKKTNDDLEENKFKQTTTEYQEEEVSDPELEELLDDALLDFGTTEAKSTKDVEGPATVPGASTGLLGASAGAPGAEGTEALFNGVFDSEAQKQLGDIMQALMNPQMMQNIEKLSEAAENSEESEESKKQFEDTLKETLGGLSQNAQDLQNNIPDDELFKLLGNMNMGGGEGAAAGDNTDFMPMMQGMMKSLLSKEVLYPSLKDISTKFPKWLEENQSKTSASELENYNKQYDYMKQICTEYEAEKDTDSESMKKERFERVLDLMQNMQELGYPPKELVGDLPGGFPLGPDGGGFPDLQSPDKCSVM